MVLMRFSPLSIASKMLKMRLLISSSTSSITNPEAVHQVVSLLLDAEAAEEEICLNMRM
ncbi:hypothetical protein V6Z12_D07G235700 [Gossypium hirsutum]